MSDEEEVSNKDLKKLLLEVRDDIKRVQDSTNKVKLVNRFICKEVILCRNKCLELEKHNDYLEKKVEKMNEEIRYLKGKETARYILLFNVEEKIQEEEDLWETVKKIFEDTSTKIEREEIESLKRVGNKPGSRPILITFVRTSSKKAVFENARKFREKKIGFANDLNKKQREERSKIKIYKEQLGKTIKVKLQDERLRYEDKYYDIDNVEFLLERHNEKDQMGDLEDL